MKNLIALTSIILTTLCCVLNSFATSYSWLGTTSTAWGTATNWSPNGIPGTSDNVTIVTKPNIPVYNGVSGITNITMTSGTLNLGGYTLNYSGTGTFNGGTITNGKIASNAGTSASFAGTIMNCKVVTTTGNLYLNGCVFNDTTKVTKTGASTNSSQGNNKFYGYTEITNNSTAIFYLGSANPDTAFNTIKYFQSNTGALNIAHTGSYINVYYGNVYLIKSGTTTSDLMVANTGTAEFHDTIFVSNTTVRHIYIGNNSGSSVALKDNATVVVGSSGFTSGTLYLKYFDKQNTNTNINLSFGTSASISIGPSSTINGTVTYSGGSFYVNGCTYNHAVSFTKTGGTANYSSGGNVFNSTASFTNSGSAAVMLANSPTGDDFNGDVTVTKNANHSTYIAHQGTSTFAGNITYAGTYTGIWMGQVTGWAILDGTSDQTFTSRAGDYARKLKINKATGGVTLSGELIIADTITFINGVISTSGSSQLVMANSSKALGASDASHVNGKVKKIGNVAFTFPVGKNGQYRSIAISAPTNTTDAYTAEYFWDNSNSVYSHSSKDAGIAQLSRAEYWKLDRNTGTTNVSVTLSWESSTSCGFSSTANLKVAAWDGTTWKDKGNGGTTGNTTAGTIVTNGVSTTYGAYGLATTATFDCFCWDATSIGSGNTCMNSQTLSTAERWYKYTADSIMTEIKVKNTSTTPFIQYLEIYTSCSGGYLVARDSIAGSGDTVLVCSPRVQTGTTLYAKLTGSGSGTATFNICKTLRAPNNFVQLYPDATAPASACGLDYAQVSVRMNQRVMGGTTAGNSPPIDFDFTNLIPAGAVLERAYLWFSTTGTHNGASAYIPDANVPYNIQTTTYNINCPVAGGIARNAPLLVNSNIITNNADNATCWGAYANYAGMQITCTYFDNLTNHFITNNFMEGLNQKYTISNLPAINNSFDITGATLMILYRKACTAQTNPSRMVIRHGLDVLRGVQPNTANIFGFNSSYLLNGLTAFTSNANERGFMLTHDLQTNFSTFDINPVNWLTPQNCPNPITGTMHNFIECSTVTGTMGSFATNQASLIFRIDQNGVTPPPFGQNGVSDCYAVSVMGAYTENADPTATCTPIAIDIVPTDNCNNNNYTLNSTLTGGAPAVTFGWGPAASITGATNTQNTTGVAATPVNFYVSATGSDGCKDVDYTVVAHCEAANQVYNICGANNTAINFLNQLDNPFGDIVTTNGIIFINSIFTVDHDINFESCPQIRLSPNARIVVNPGFTLVLKACTLDVCENYMWDGIYLTTNGANVSELIAGGCEFRQAINAIVSDNGGDYDVSQCTFRDCHIGIRVQNYNPANSAAHPGTVFNTTFIQSGTLLSPYCQERYFAGIDVFAVDDLTIGTNGAGQNTFNTLRYGVRAERSDVTLANNLFTNVGNVQAPPFTYNGTPSEGAVVTWAPIYQSLNVIDCKIRVLGNGATVHNTFTNCNFGVYSLWQTAEVVNGNVFTNVDNGVWCVDCLNALVAGPASTSGNTFTNSNTGTAIRIENITAFPRNERVYFNIINGHNTGIFTLKTAGVRIQNNTVNFSTAGSTTRGIRAENTRNTIIYNNIIDHTITPILGNQGYRFGILSTHNRAPHISKNTLNEMGSGIVSEGGNVANILSCNTHNYCYHGFNFRAIPGFPTVTMSNQCNLPPWNGGPIALRITGNDWYNMVSGGMRVRGGVTSPLKLWLYPTGAPVGTAYSPHNVTPLSAVTNMFIQPSLTTTPCPYTPAQPPVDTTQRRLLFQQIVLDTADLGEFANEMRYSQQEWAYQTFRETPDWLTLDAATDGIYQNFYDDMELTNLEKFLLAEDTVYDGDFTAAININNSISAVNTIEQYRKTVNAIFFNTWAQGNFYFTKADSTTLSDIAYEHGYLYGPGVYMARVLLGLNIEDDYEGTSKTDELSDAPNEDYLQYTKIYPNPNDGQMQMDYLLPENSTGFLEILDINGRVLQNYQLFAGMHTMAININQHDQGLYFARLYVDGNYKYTDKIAVIK